MEEYEKSLIVGGNIKYKDGQFGNVCNLIFDVIGLPLGIYDHKTIIDVCKHFHLAHYFI